MIFRASLLVLGTITSFALFQRSVAAEFWTQDTSFVPALESSNATRQVDISCPYPGGKVVFYSGSDRLVNGTAIPNGLYRLNSDGSLDRTFQGPASTKALLAYADGTILALAKNDSGVPELCWLRPDGGVNSVVPAVPTNDYDRSARAVLLADGRTLVFGNFSNVGGSLRRWMVVLKANGSVDDTFVSPLTNSSSPDYLRDVVQAPDGSIYVGGRFQVNGVEKKLVRLSRTGAYDDTFDVSAAFDAAVPYRIYPQNSGKVMVVNEAMQVVRLNVNGSLDSSFVPSLVGRPNDFGAVRRDGRVYYTTMIIGFDFLLQELRLMDPDGADDSSFPVILRLP